VRGAIGYRLSARKRKKGGPHSNRLCDQHGRRIIGESPGGFARTLPIVKIERSESDQVHAILRAVCSAGSDAWCFVPIGCDFISHCTAGFLNYWDISLGVPDQTGEVISLDNPFLSAAFEKAGLNGHWLMEACESYPHLAAEMLELPSENISIRVERSVILDHSGRPVGRMFSIPGAVAQQIPLDVLLRAREAKKFMARLTPREEEILDLVFYGFTNKAIGRQASISEKTVEKHRASIMRKLQSQCMADLIQRVTEARLLTSGRTS
jgi:DNA-binding CsgD family transcriptional regulator